MNNVRDVTAIILAAGSGIRFGAVKQTQLLKGQPVLHWTLAAFDQSRDVNGIILVVRPGAEKTTSFSEFGKIKAIVSGGDERSDSVVAGFERLDPIKADIVLVHDGVRPLVGESLITRVVLSTAENGAAVPVIPIEDTIKKGDGEWIVRTEDRRCLFRAQTPQGFKYDVLRDALKESQNRNWKGTDDSYLVEKTGKKVAMVQGDPRNVKITHPDDLVFLEALIVE